MMVQSYGCTKNIKNAIHQSPQKAVKAGSPTFAGWQMLAGQTSRPECAVLTQHRPAVRRPRARQHLRRQYARDGDRPLCALRGNTVPDMRALASETHGILVPVRVIARREGYGASYLKFAPRGKRGFEPLPCGG